MSATNNQSLVFEAHGREFAIYLKRTPALFTILGIAVSKRTDDDFEAIIDRVEIDALGCQFSELGVIDYAIVCGATVTFLGTCFRGNFGNASKM